MNRMDLEAEYCGGQLPIPVESLYGNTEYSRPDFNKYDSPNAFWELTDEQQSALVEWCQQLGKRKTIYHGRTSYGLKHLFERNGFYVYNGAFKGAMLLAGFRVAGLEYADWWFNVSERSVKEVIRREFREDVWQQ